MKKKFAVDGKIEHMWVDVSRIEGAVIRGRLANTPQKVTSLQLGDHVALEFDEIEDWFFMRAAEQVGGFQASVLKNRQSS